MEANSLLLAATVSVGNVGQLSCEALLASYKCELAGYLINPCVLPCFGHDPHPNVSVGLSLELYALLNTPRPVYILQQRAPVMTGFQRSFSSDLAEWIASSGFRTVLLSSSVEAEARKEEQLMERKLWYVRADLTVDPKMQSHGIECLRSLVSHSLWLLTYNRAVGTEGQPIASLVTAVRAP